MSQQVGNANQAPESQSVQDAVMGMSSDDFFESLDNQVNGGILDEPSQPTSEPVSYTTLTLPTNREV